MTTAKKIWPHTEVAAHLEEILQLAESEPQRITRPDGVTLVVQKEPQERAFTPAIAAFRSMPRDGSLVIDRPKDPPRLFELAVV